MRLGYGEEEEEEFSEGEASMRPRRMRLGYALQLSGGPLVLMSFNEAEAHAPRILGGIPRLATWAHELQ